MPKGKSVYLTDEELIIVNSICESILQSSIKGNDLDSKIFDRVTKATVADLQKKL